MTISEIKLLRSRGGGVWIEMWNPVIGTYLGVVQKK